MRRYAPSWPLQIFETFVEITGMLCFGFLMLVPWAMIAGVIALFIFGVPK